MMASYRKATQWSPPWSKVAARPPTALALVTMSHWRLLVAFDKHVETCAIMRPWSHPWSTMKQQSGEPHVEHAASAASRVP